jgi:hypothetical protein
MHLVGIHCIALRLNLATLSFMKSVMYLEEVDHIVTCPLNVRIVNQRECRC